MAFERGRQKSFGEPTRVRTDGSRSDAEADAPRGKPAGSAYDKYKRDLHAFFNGEKPLPDHLKDLLATRPGAAEHGIVAEETAPAQVRPDRKDERKDDKKPPRRVVNGPSDDVAALTEAVRRASSPREVETAIDALRLKGATLPKEADILSKALGHGSDAVLEEALRGLLAVEPASIKSPQLLKTRVKNVALLASSSDVRELCAQLPQQLS